MSVHNPTAEMERFIAQSPHLGSVALAQDRATREFFGQDIYDLYEQGSQRVIDLRANAPPAGASAHPSPPHGTNPRKRYCSLCRADKIDFARHNREEHIKDPIKALYCPHEDCDVIVRRDGTITIDDHLANAHHDFRHTDGRGGDLLERSTQASVLGHLNISALRYVAQDNQLQAEAVIEEQARLSDCLNGAYPDIDIAFPVALAPGHACSDVEHMSGKPQLINYIVKLRQELTKWDVRFKVAEDIVAGAAESGEAESAAEEN